MKPFNLERALAGDPVITRDGQEVKIGAYFSDAKPYHQVIGWVGGKMEAWGKDGRYFDLRDIPDDLFMAPKKRTVTTWLNWYKGGYGSAYPTKEHADRMASEGRLACTEHTIEIEDEND